MNTTDSLVKVEYIFTVKYGVNLQLVHLEQCNRNSPDAIYFVSRTEKNNGVSAVLRRLEDTKPNPAHTISVETSGSVMSSFYQRLPYYSGRDLYFLLPK